MNYASDSLEGPHYEIVCGALKTITIPPSIKSISFDLYPETLRTGSGYIPCYETEIDKVVGIEYLDGESFSNLLYIIRNVKPVIDDARTMGYLTENGKMTFYKDDHLLLLDPDKEEEEIIIPEGIKSIGAGAIGNQIKYDGFINTGTNNKSIHIGTLNVGKTVETIGRKAFSYNGNSGTIITIDRLIINDKLVKERY